ncbi:hypothetical protein [Marimonas arenosa]|uniref:Uncharacterized protein n=1 Tax=Marimonas arenosa TaxID=1795305 RepID=A0AAE4B4T0_9RHOB|nr:hypothetical protein [Marimonas arenosa]MDQ2091368.1 hypothetical protein [Marimonas arenosa]
MQNLSERLSRELIRKGNLPISAEGIVRLRPDIAGEMTTAQTVLDDEFELEPQVAVRGQAEKVEEDVLEARFVPASGDVQQQHLFVLEAPETQSDDDRIKRWSKMPVSYGSFVQIKKFLTEAWGEIRDLEVQLSKVQLSRMD